MAVGSRGRYGRTPTNNPAIDVTQGMKAGEWWHIDTATGRRVEGISFKTKGEAIAAAEANVRKDNMSALDNIAFGLQQANAAAKKLVARMDAAAKQITTAQYNSMLNNGWQVVWEPRGPYHVAELKNSSGRTSQFEVTDWRNDAARHDVTDRKEIESLAIKHNAKIMYDKEGRVAGVTLNGRSYTPLEFAELARRGLGRADDTMTSMHAKLAELEDRLRTAVGPARDQIKREISETAHYINGLKEIGRRK